ncbi:OpgC domain-containing protein [Nocardioides acrostichi]|uniref:OpgC domain-containing protein n=1 Tax=Nocardioides acrostichi TaxID=2784339 RepID=A0A930YB72_9ACTN|nr:OpgC domain-containing protein [Nocardioides acrostichi]MBF4162158.1 OpgC domain-containing protein [Nocardioides acrostichi]
MPTRLSRLDARPLHSLILLRLALALVLGVLVLNAAPERADAADDDPAPAAGHPWFGPYLTWSSDLPRDYGDRLGATPSLYAQQVDYPLTDDSRTYLRQFAEQAATQGAVALLTLEPNQGLSGLDESDARELARELVRLHRAYDSFFLVRFGPEMNGSWTPWGQQPQAYRAAFRTVADAVHAATDQALMVWSPVYGAGYPFGAAYGDIAPGQARDITALDTDDDGSVDDDDDPYGPYWPGQRYADWVGITFDHFGDDRRRVDNSLDVTRRGIPQGQDEDGTGFATNTVPAADAVSARWDETFGYTDPGRPRTSFYDRFAVRYDKRVVLDTAALWQPDRPGDDEVAIKRAWWKQVFDSLPGHPLVGAIDWLEQRRPEAEADQRVVDWRATHTAALADALLRDLREARVDLGPVTDVVDLQAGNEATAQGRLPDQEFAASNLGWIVVCAVALAVVFLLAGLVGRFVPSWRYPDDGSGRDHRVDLLRGFMIIAVVITHVELAGPWSYITLNMVGAITGAELFVLLSGIVLGMIYAPTVRKLGEWATAVSMWKRARKQYLVSLAVVLLVYGLGRIPFVDATALTTFTDRGTGEGGAGATGRVYDLYANADRLLDYPPPWYAVKELLLLEIGPWIFNIMGLFVVLSLLLPLLMVLVQRRLWWVLLALSWVAYVVGVRTEWHVLPSQFESVFPLLIWQLPFVHGLVVGAYRQRIVDALTGRLGKILTGLFVVGYAVVLGWLWLAQQQGWAPDPFPADSYAWLGEHAYLRVVLQPGRLVDLVFFCVVSFGVLTTCWRPINAVIGWLWTPLGQASLYVFVVHVFFALAVANVPGLDRSSWWQGLVLHTAVVGLIWLMVRHKVLFSVIPR